MFISSEINDCSDCWYNFYVLLSCMIRPLRHCVGIFHRYQWMCSRNVWLWQCHQCLWKFCRILWMQVSIWIQTKNFFSVCWYVCLYHVFVCISVLGQMKVCIDTNRTLLSVANSILTMVHIVCVLVYMNFILVSVCWPCICILYSGEHTSSAYYSSLNEYVFIVYYRHWWVCFGDVWLWTELY